MVSIIPSWSLSNGSLGTMAVITSLSPVPTHGSDPASPVTLAGGWVTLVALWEAEGVPGGFLLGDADAGDGDLTTLGLRQPLSLLAVRWN